MSRSIQWPPRIYVHGPSGRARIRVNGKDYYLGKDGSPEAKREYARLVTELAAQGLAGPARERDVGPGLTVVEVLARFMTHARRHYSARGGQTVKFQQALAVVEQIHGAMPVAQFGAAQLREVQAAMAARGWCAPVVNRHIVRVRTAWRWLEEEDRTVPPGSWAALKVVGPLRPNHPSYRQPPARQRTTDMDQVRRVCRGLAAPMRAALLVQWWSGARTSEVRIMRKGDVDTSGDVWAYRPRQHKNDWRGHDRVIVLGPKAQAALRPWLEACTGPDDYVFPPAPHRHHVDAVGQRLSFRMDAYDRSRCYTLCAHAQAIRRAANAAGLEGFHAYACRHATRMRISRQASDEAARAALGQKSLDTTMKYGELDQKLARDTQRKLG